MRSETVVRRVGWGVELVDALRQGPLLSPAHVRPFTDGLRVLEATPSRFFAELERERIDDGARTFEVHVEARGYVPELFSAEIPAAVIPEVLELLPAPGYAFSPTLPRIDGRVVLGSPAGDPVEGAVVRFTTLEGSFTAGRGTTRSVKDGLYTMWLRSDTVGTAGPINRFRVDTTWSRDGTSYTGSVIISAPRNAIVHGAPLLVIS